MERKMKTALIAMANGTEDIEAITTSFHNPDD